MTIYKAEYNKELYFIELLDDRGLAYIGGFYSDGISRNMHIPIEIENCKIITDEFINILFPKEVISIFNRYLENMIFE